MKRKVFFKNISGEGLSPLEIYLKFLDENNSYFLKVLKEERNGLSILLSAFQLKQDQFRR